MINKINELEYENKKLKEELQRCKQMLTKLGDKPQIDSKLDELNNEGRSLMKSIV